MDNPRTGLIIGKFMPLHKGHELLIDFAAHYVDFKLNVIVCTREDDPIDGWTRYQWVKDTYAGHPRIHVIHFPNNLPEYPEEAPLFFYSKWAEALANVVMPVDIVFASEPYGQELADALRNQWVKKTRFIPFERNSLPVSGTQIRNNPYENWRFLSDPVKIDWQLRVCLTGPESCGKSTLTEKLAKMYGMDSYVPEYGRTWLEEMRDDDEWDGNDIDNITQGHEASVNAHSGLENGIVFMDTDLFITKMYADMVNHPVNGSAIRQMQETVDLYLLMTPDVPWVADPLRNGEQKIDRMKFYVKVKKELELKNLPYRIINGGDFKYRENQALIEVEELIIRKIREIKGEPLTL